MITQETAKKYFVYVPHYHERVEVSREVHHAYYEDRNALRKEKHRRLECVCPPKKYYMCDGDCAECSFKLGNDGARDWILGRTAAEDVCSNEEVEDVAICYERKDCYDHLRRVIDMLSDHEKDIVSKVMNGFSLGEIAEEKGMPKTTLHYQWQKICDKLRKQLVDYR
jgi:DNA-directed RNA polymerase specialized sigma24 family protein